MTFVLILASLLNVSLLSTLPPSSNFIESNKKECIEKIKSINDHQLWSIFLELQTDLFFNSEFKWIMQQKCWQQANTILEIGSGEGSYLNKLSENFHTKTFKGIEIQSEFVKEANNKYLKCGLSFEVGNAEVLNQKLKNTADLVLFRLTLHHLKDPYIALQNAADYLFSNGYVVIIGTHDKAKKTSHVIPSLDRAFDQVAEIQKENGRGNRQITLQIQQAIEEKKDPLGKIYEIVYTNLDQYGKVIEDTICFKGEKDRRNSFNHHLLLAEIFHRIHSIPINLSEVFDDLLDYYKDENAWTSPGWHFLILRKLDF